MADDKQGRDKQAQDEDRRQRERDMNEARERADEAEPVDPEEGLRELLEMQEYPATAVDLIDAFGNQVIEDSSDIYTLEELLEDVAEETYDSPEEAQVDLQEVLDRR